MRATEAAGTPVDKPKRKLGSARQRHLRKKRPPDDLTEQMEIMTHA